MCPGLLHIHQKPPAIQISSHYPAFSTYSDLGYVQVLCLLTQHWHIKRRQTSQIRREERLFDSCLPGWVTLLRDPLRRAQPWVMSVPQSGRKTSNTRPVQPPPLCSSLSCCSPELHGGSLKTIPAVTTPWISPIYPLAATTLSHSPVFFLSLISIYYQHAKWMKTTECVQHVYTFTPHHWSLLSLPYCPVPSLFCFLNATLLAAKTHIPGTRSDVQCFLSVGRIG